MEPLQKGVEGGRAEEVVENVEFEEEEKGDGGLEEEKERNGEDTHLATK